MLRIQREERVQQALKDLAKDSNLSQAEAARQNNVAKSTLSDRRQNKLSGVNQRHTNAKLTFYQEEVLAKLIRSSQEMFRPVNFPEIRAMANALAKENNKDVQPIGANWITKFIKRHPYLASRRELHLVKDRAEASKPVILSQWFDAVEVVINGVEYLPDDIWNMDEVGARHNHHQSESICFDRRSGLPISVTNKRTSWTSSLECINAIGQVIKPLVIHQGRNPHQPLDEWFPPTPNLPNWYWGFTEKGWTSNAYGARWFDEIFLPQTETGRPRLLYMDAHSSHITGLIQDSARRNNVKVIWLLPHASHILQPLDQQPFAILKAAYAERLKAFDPTGTRNVTRSVFDILWAQARGIAFTTQYIQSGWLRSGLWPFNKQRVLNRRDVRQQRSTTPPLQPDKTPEYRTPKRKGEWLPIMNSIRAVIPQSHQLQLARIERHLDELEAEVSVLRAQLRNQEEQVQNHEDALVHKRIRKLQDSIITSFEDVLRHRGADDDEIKLLCDQQPSVFAVMEDRQTRSRIQRRAAVINNNMKDS